LGVTTVEQFLFLLGICVFVLLVASLSFKALTAYSQARFTQMREYSIGKRLVEGYLDQPYSWFLNRHSAELGKTILSEVGVVINQGATPMMNLIAHGAVAIALLTLLLLVDPKLAVIISFTLTCAYALVFSATRGLLERIGQERVTANQERFTALSGAFGAAKEVKVGGLESAYTQRFAEPAQTFAKHQATASVISQLPRFAIEAIAFGGMLLLVLYLMASSGSFESALPIVALYAFAGYRLMPALQHIYAALTQVRFVGAALSSLHADLMSLKPAHTNECSETIQLQNAITLNNVTYRYPSAKKAALASVNLSIPVRSTIGLVGSTGSGKTTTVDLMLGLLEAQEGSLKIDGQPISEHNKRAWQRAIGYVPQHIYLADDTVAANIAFGLEAKDIDQTAVERAAKIANLHEFVVNDLPQGYSTTVGERGVRLSGGQRQRIGIARGLYHNPQVLILDEATSALDNLTEHAVMEAVNNLGRDITIILIAHRLSTVRQCDQIYLLERGEVKASGTYEQLTASSEQFKAMAGGAL
jgi:ABC-type bacteriocin/lantibiotic exporter with double-glycine peptidase domain